MAYDQLRDQLWTVVRDNCEKNTPPNAALQEFKGVFANHEYSTCDRLQEMQTRCAALAQKLGHPAIATTVLTEQDVTLPGEIDGDIEQLKVLLRRMALLAGTRGNQQLVTAAKKAQGQLNQA